jgi:hypothetical protein
MGNRVIDLTGQRFGRLLVEQRAGSIGSQASWLCRCDCGTEKILDGGGLRRKHAQSCGCRRRDPRGGITHRNGRMTPEYAAWSQAKARCNDVNHQAYHWYGGRGLRMAPEWAGNFRRFLADMGPRPSPAHSLDRIDNDGDYAPGNCRWALKATQHNNRRSNVRVEWRGESRTVAEWATATGIRKTALYQRLDHGWPLDRALTEPVRQRRQAC